MAERGGGMRMKRTRTAETVGAFLPRFLSSFAGKKKYQENFVFFHWADIVGDVLAAHVQPVRLDFHTLFLAADAPVWANELTYMRGTLRDKINGYVGEELVREIRFGPALGRRRVFSPAPAVKREGWQGPDEGEKQAAQAACEAVADDRVRDAAARAMAQSLARRRQATAAGDAPCRRCGVPGGGTRGFCSACQRQRKEEKRIALRRILSERPWLRYHEVAKLLDVSAAFVLAERRRLAQEWAGRLTRREEIGEEEKKLVMLFSTISPNELTETKARQVMTRLRFDLRADFTKAAREKTPRRYVFRAFRRNGREA